MLNYWTHLSHQPLMEWLELLSFGSHLMSDASDDDATCILFPGLGQLVTRRAHQLVQWGSK